MLMRDNGIVKECEVNAFASLNVAFRRAVNDLKSSRCNLIG
jgi:hypothetical protein